MKDLIKFLKDNKIELNYGIGDYPVSCSFYGGLYLFDEKLTSKIKKIKHSQWNYYQ